MTNLTLDTEANNSVAAAALSARAESVFKELSEALGGLLCDRASAVFVAQQFDTAVSLLVQHLKMGDADSAGDYVSGWLRLVSLQYPEVFADPPFSDKTLRPALNRWKALLTDGATDSMTSCVDALIEQIGKKLGQTSSGRTVRALFVGDCLVWDIATQIQILANGCDVDIEPTVVAKRVGADLRRSLRAFTPDQFDLIFYSPFSFGFSEEYAQYTASSRMLSAVSKGVAPLREALDETFKSITLMHSFFDSPLYIHSVSGVCQNTSGFSGWVSNLVSRPVRRWAATYLDARLSAFIKGLVAAGNKNAVRRVNEADPLRWMSSYKLGQAIYDAGELHPTALARELAGGAYLRAVIATAHMKNRKLIVCDLDNTLWDGVIGDGPVNQHSYRQKVILRLKAKGVLLAVSSKNDPANVRWDEAIVAPEDFVAMQINWGRKASNIRNIANLLNLNPNSFLFLDDRPDERESVMEELPGLLSLDPNEPETWELMEEWAAILCKATLEDRTAMYKERAERQSYLDDHTEVEDTEEAYRKLGLRLEMRKPRENEMERVVELINRTNQFNTTTARTSMAEMADSDTTRHIIIAQASDRFGDMGIVGALVVTGTNRKSITHFVLSCRVFGFGIETAMVQSALAYFKKQTLYARLVATPVNTPCRHIYAHNGFKFDGECWISTSPMPELVPDWMHVTDAFAQAGA